MKVKDVLNHFKLNLTLSDKELLNEFLLDVELTPDEMYDTCEFANNVYTFTKQKEDSDLIYRLDISLVESAECVVYDRLGHVGEDKNRYCGTGYGRIGVVTIN